MPFIGMRGAVILLSFFLPFFASAECFSRNLTLDTTGEDVKKVQKILNMTQETRVSETGSGSLGNETTYFGPRTRLAVIKFQNMYREEVLTPVGLSAGTGYVGVATRKKLETLCSLGTSATLPPLPTTPPLKQATSSSNGVSVFFPSEYSGVPGVLRMISGDGFIPNAQNTVYFGPYSATGTAQSNSELFVFIPNIPTGKYPLWVENQNGTSTKDAFFIVRDPNVPEPALTSLSPTSGKAGTKVEIRGTGFTPTHNTIHTGLNVVENVVSQGGAIEWIVPTSFSGGKETTSIPVWIYVVNERGVSKELVFQMNI